MAGRGKLIAVIGDEDTVTGFLLGGIGELNKNRHPNFLVVEKDTTINEIEDTFRYGSQAGPEREPPPPGGSAGGGRGGAGTRRRGASRPRPKCHATFRPRGSGNSVRLPFGSGGLRAADSLWGFVPISHDRVSGRKGNRACGGRRPSVQPARPRWGFQSAQARRGHPQPLCRDFPVHPLSRLRVLQALGSFAS